MNTKSQKKHKQKQEKLKAYIINLNVTSTKHKSYIPPTYIVRENVHLSKFILCWTPTKMEIHKNQSEKLSSIRNSVIVILSRKV